MALINSSTVSAGDQVLASQYNNLRKDSLLNTGAYATTGGSANAYTLSIDAQITAYETGMKIRFKASFTNTGASTVDVNSIGAKNIYTADVKALTGGELKQNTIYEATYDGTQFLLTGFDYSYEEVTATSKTIVADTVYVANNADLITFTLPSTSYVGEFITIIGKGDGGFKVAQNAGQNIIDDGFSSTSGTSGFLVGKYSFSTVRLRCVVADTTWVVENKLQCAVDTALFFTEKDFLGGRSSFNYTVSAQTYGVSDDQLFYTSSENPSGTGNVVLLHKNVLQKGTGYFARVTTNTVVGSDKAVLGVPVIYKNYIYFAVTGSPYELWRCSIDDDITVGGNWTSLTLSGFPSTWKLVGCAEGQLWFVDTNASPDVFFPATISGTTVTKGTSLSNITGGDDNGLVNYSGIYVNFTSGAQVRKYTHAGSAVTGQTFTALDTNVMDEIAACTKWAGYVRMTTDGTGPEEVLLKIF